MVASAIMVGLLAAASLSIDIGYLLYVRTRLQATADAAALAAAQEIPRDLDALSAARQYATVNESGDGSVLADEDVDLGRWNTGSRTFALEEEPKNAVRVRIRRSTVNGNPVGTWFARIIGIDSVDVEAEAIAFRSEGGAGSRFLIDQEMIDSDEPSIEELASRYGMTPEEIISDNDGDWFIDLPAGEVLELPTGQVGDPALFDSTIPCSPSRALRSLLSRTSSTTTRTRTAGAII